MRYPVRPLASRLSFVAYIAAMALLVAVVPIVSMSLTVPDPVLACAKGCASATCDLWERVAYAALGGLR